MVQFKGSERLEMISALAYHLRCRLASSWRVGRLTGQPKRAALA